MKIEFNKKTTRTVTDKRAVTFDEFKELLLKHKPKEIWCEPWSSKKPLYVITEYLDENSLLGYCNANSNLTPLVRTFQSIYKSMRYSGLVDAHFIAPTKIKGVTSAIKSMEKQFTFHDIELLFRENQLPIKDISNQVSQARNRGLIKIVRRVFHNGYWCHLYEKIEK